MNDLVLLPKKAPEETICLAVPGVGIARCTVAPGQVVVGGQDVGVLTVLGQKVRLIVPNGVRGVVHEIPTYDSDFTVRGSCAYGDTFLVLRTTADHDENATNDAAPEPGNTTGHVQFLSPSAGRFYLRPAPDKDPFVSEGDIIETGQVVFLLEVMKTFSRITYGGAELPAKARIVRILPKDGEDLEAHSPVLFVEALD